MKILCIGNSFSEDATYYLKKAADSADVDLYVVNLYIGGCTVATHAENIKNDAPLYRYELNGVYTDRKVSVAEALREDKWDIVTVQQQSGRAGVYDTYEEMPVLLDCVKKHAPKAKIYFLQTWTYETDSTHPNFPWYNSDQQKMYGAIKETVDKVCLEYGLPQIPAGDAVQAVRQHPLFDYKNGGQSLCRDGFHMHVVYGRYLLALVLLTTFTGVNANRVTFVPAVTDIVNGYSAEGFECDTEKIQIIKNTVAKMMED